MTKLVYLSLLVLAASGSLAQTVAERTNHYNIKKNVAIEGYDPVSYFHNRPQEGKSSITETYKGITYLFTNDANRERFKGNPEKYEPAYGGWCAYAMGATGEKVKIDPETFKVIEGKVYLFYNFWGNNTLKDWNKNEKPLKTKADQNWKKFIP